MPQHAMIAPMQDQLTAAIANDLGISDLPLGEQQELIASFGEVALKAATIAILERLPQEKRDEFVRLSEAGDPVAIKAFLDKEVPGHDDIAKQAVALEVKAFKEASA